MILTNQSLGVRWANAVCNYYDDGQDIMLTFVHCVETESASLGEVIKDLWLFNVDICYNTVPFICFCIFCEIVADEENLMCVDILLYKI